MSTQSTQGNLQFITSAEMLEQREESDQDSNGIGFKRKGAAVEKLVVGTVNLDSLKNTINNVSEALNDSVVKKGPFAIDEVEISLGIDGKGQVGLLGTGIEMGASASIKVVLKREKANSEGKATG